MMITILWVKTKLTRDPTQGALTDVSENSMSYDVKQPARRIAGGARYAMVIWIPKLISVITREWRVLIAELRRQRESLLPEKGCLLLLIMYRLP